MRSSESAEGQSPADRSVLRLDEPSVVSLIRNARPHWPDMLDLCGALLRQRRASDARILADELSARHPEAAEPFMLRAAIAHDEGEWTLGIAMLQRAFDTSPWHPEATGLLARRWWQDGRVPELVALARRAVAENPAKHVPLIGYIGFDASIEMAEFELAEHFLRVLDGKARQLERRNHLAREARNWAASEAPHEPAGRDGRLRRRIDALVAEGDPDAIRPLLRRSLMEPKPGARDLIAIRTAAGRLRMTLTERWALRQMRDHHPGYPGQIMILTDFLSQLGAHREASRLYDDLSQASAQQADMLLRSATYMASAGGMALDRLEEAAAALEPKLADPGVASLARRFIAQSHARPVRRDVSIGSVSALPAPALAAGDRRPRVAICMSGQLRGFRNAWPQTRKALAGEDVTVFVSTWADAGSGLGQRLSVDRRLPVGLMPRLAGEHMDSALFARSFPGLSTLLTGRRSYEREELQAYFGTPHVEIEDEEDFNRRHEHRTGLYWLNKLNQAKMFYMIHQAHEQMRRFEEAEGRRFDVVIRLRCDNGISELAREDLLYAASEPVCLVPSSTTKLHDRSAMMSRQVSSSYASVYPNLNRHGDARYFEGATGQFAEYLIGGHLIDQGVAVGLFKGTKTTSLLSDQPSLQEFGEILTAEIQGREDLDTFESAVVVATIETMAATRSIEAMSRLWQAVPAGATTARARLDRSFAAKVMASGAPAGG
ncbi:tetratricopeptide repeat protein [Roseomonas populi]|uniref:Tetratricopeptide repeat protein n=1 Tax=Roseomonas populi TaxID=3121582 RepID=A0ABT1X3P1_9PROT|nr:hypothetical protein [Roseomonas pecuniae]MCR0982008.1 hypothetical protein [Roseomonas pecuniae]